MCLKPRKRCNTEGIFFKTGPIIKRIYVAYEQMSDVTQVLTYSQVKRDVNELNLAGREFQLRKRG